MARTRTFDDDDVIERAMNVFRVKGYAGTSVQDLVRATGLLKGSLYGAFGSKENLFRLALQQYATRIRRDFISNEPPLDYLRNGFSRTIDDAAGGEYGCGCFVMNTCEELGGPDASELAKTAESILKEYEKNFAKALRRARDRGELPAGVDAGELAHRLTGAAFAIRQMSRFRRDRRLFTAIANGVLRDLNIEI